MSERREPHGEADPGLRRGSGCLRRGARSLRRGSTSLRRGSARSRTAGLLLAGTFLAVGCGDAGRPGEDPAPSADPVFHGVSETRPTGSGDIAAEGLVASYDLSSETEDGRLRDFGPHGLHGEPAAPRRVPGVFGEAQLFERVGHRIHLPEDGAFDLPGPLTIAAWVRVDSLGLHQHIAACDDRWALWVTPDDRYRLGDTRGGGWSTAPGTVEPGIWKPVVAVLAGTAGDPIGPETVTLWVNGVATAGESHMRTEAAEAAGVWNPGQLYPEDACYLGFESHQGNEAHQEMPFVGAIDELLIFSRAWSYAEVSAFSNRPSPERDPGDPH